MDQGPYVLEKDAAGLLIVSLCSREAMVRPDTGILVQETDLPDRGNNSIASERALTSQGSLLKSVPLGPSHLKSVPLGPPNQGPLT